MKVRGTAFNSYSHINKVEAIKTLRRYIPLGLKEAKDAIELMLGGNPWVYEFNSFVNNEIFDVKNEVTRAMNEMGIHLSFNVDYNTQSIKAIISKCVEDNKFDMAMDLIMVLKKHS